MALLSVTLVLPMASAQANWACVDGCGDTRSTCMQTSFNGSSSAYQQCDDNWEKHTENCAASYDKGSKGYKNCIASSNISWDDCTRTARRNQDNTDDKCGEAYDACYSNCWKTGGRSAGSGSAQLRVNQCPDGSVPNELGLCQVRFRLSSENPGEDGCEPGHVRGKDDRCVPNVTVSYVPLPDGYLVACPKGMKPSPIDGGCVMGDVGPVEVEPMDGFGRNCPPGTRPSPNDGLCVPILPRYATDDALQWLMRSVAIAASRAPIPYPTEPATLDGQLLETSDIATAMEVTGAQMKGDMLPPE